MPVSCISEKILYTQDTPYTLSGGVHEAASVYCMGPRPLFCTPCRGVKFSTGEVGVLVPHPEHEVQRLSNTGSRGPYPGLSKEEYFSHPLVQYYHANTNTYAVSLGDGTVVYKKQRWMEKHVIPMCTQLLVRAWSTSLQKIWKHILHSSSKNRLQAQGQQQHAGQAQHAAADQTDNLERQFRRDGVHLLCTVVPPRESIQRSAEDGIWVSMEVKHTIGNLKGMSYADMITLQVPAKDLVAVSPDALAAAEAVSDRMQYIRSSRSSCGKRRRRSGSASGEEESSSSPQHHDDDEQQQEDEEDILTVYRFIYASEVDRSQRVI